jgi:Bacterial regulatory helix-turn-helix protein, lysR family
MKHFDFRRIDLNLLVTFDALMTTRSVTRAAERLGLGQPAVLAFTVEFVIIALILVSQFIYAAQIPSATEYKIASALLFPIALAMVELARVPLAIAVRTQNSWNIKFAALIGVMCAVAVTAVSLSNIGNLTFNPRLEDAQDKHNRL